MDVAAADASLEAAEPPTLVWDNFFAAVAKVWELSRPKRLGKDLMLNFVRHLR